MLHPSTKRLIDRLSEMTRKQKVKWTQGEDGQLFHDTEGYRVILTSAPHEVHVTDALGRAIETVSAEDFQSEVDANGRPYTSFVSELYREADRHARGAEQAIDALLRGLDRDGDGVPDHLQDGPGQPMRPELAAGTGVATAAAHEAQSAPETVVEDIPEDVTDETESFDQFVGTDTSGQERDLDVPDAFDASDDTREMTEAVANMAEQINGTTAAAASGDLVESGADLMGDEIADFDRTPATDSDVHPTAGFGTPIPMDEPVEPTPETVQAAPADPPSTPRVAAGPATLSGGFFGRSMGGNLDRYKAQPTTTSETPVPADPPAQDPYSAASESTEPVSENDTPAEAPASGPRPISLSGLASGFGLGSAATPAAGPDPAPAREPIAEPQPGVRRVIDGTADLPDIDPSADMEEEAFSFNPAPSEPQAEPEPDPAAFSPPEPETQVEEENEEPAAPPKPASRFNPWN